jgi:hypothetical protein
MAAMRTPPAAIAPLENAGRRHHAATAPAWVRKPMRVRNGDDFFGEMISCVPRMSATEVRLEEVVTKD